MTAPPSHLQLRSIALVAFGGALGALARYGVGEVWHHHGRDPWPTFVINLVGAFVLGALLERLSRAPGDDPRVTTTRLVVGTGFCGAFTTYSTFAHDLVTMTHHSPLRTLAWGGGQVLLGLLSAALGAAAGARQEKRA